MYIYNLLCNPRSVDGPKHLLWFVCFVLLLFDYLLMTHFELWLSWQWTPTYCKCKMRSIYIVYATCASSNYLEENLVKFKLFSIIFLTKRNSNSNRIWLQALQVKKNMRGVFLNKLPLAKYLLRVNVLRDNYQDQCIYTETADTFLFTFQYCRYK